MSSSVSVFREEDLVRVGRAPFCAKCDVFMVPLNFETDKKKCKCSKCGAVADMILAEEVS